MQVACRSRLPRARSYRIVGQRVWGLLHVAQRDPASSAAVMSVPERVGMTALIRPGGRSCGRSARRRAGPAVVVRGRHWPFCALADGQVDARAVRRQRSTLPLLQVIVIGARAPRPSCSMSAPVASGPARSARAARSACSHGGPADQQGAELLRSRATACDFVIDSRATDVGGG